MQDTEEIFLPDSKQCQNNVIPPEVSTGAGNYEVVPTHEVFSASLDETVDIRPRVWDNITKEYVLVDCGSQVSVLKPSPDDIVTPGLKLETVDGSEIKCYGKKN